MRSTLLLAAFGLVLALAGLPSAPPPPDVLDPGPSTLPAVLDDGRACSPRGPLALDVAAGHDVDGTLEVSWVVTPLLDVTDLEVRVALPDGALVVREEGAGAGLDGGAGRVSTGRARVRLPRGPAAQALTVVAEARLPRSGEPVVVERVVWTEVARGEASRVAFQRLGTDTVTVPGRALVPVVHGWGR